MDYDKLIEDLRRRGLGNGSALGHHSGLYEDAALAIETLRAEAEQERAHRIHAEQHADAFLKDCERLNSDLARVTAERDAAVSDISSVLAEVEEIRRGYGVDNADADDAFANLCGNYCAKCGDNCYQEAENYRCKNYEWRGIKED